MHVSAFLRYAFLASPIMPTYLAIFPPNGLDRSLHTAVLIGLCFGTLFTETYGWSYAGLVVPGYLATVFFAAPITGVFIVLEAILTYLLVAFIGKWITRTGVWSTAFGRERFYLFIVVAVVVRLILEGSLVPLIDARYGLWHSRELYSIGLVLVPLLANAFWNTGLLKAFPRVAIVTALTAAVLFVLLRTTNLSVSRFQVLNESLSLEFLESPKAHIILVIGALLGARNNVRYGWDYNGILVPGLLAVAWYEPTKLVTTTVEALVVYWLSRGLTQIRPFSRMLLVGPRRMLFTYVVGYIVKLILGFTTARYVPGLQMIDYFGFGYLLPSLLAVKMWNKERVGIVIMPTLQVSLIAFVLGNTVGYLAVALDRAGDDTTVTTSLGVPRSVDSAAFALLLADTVTAPAPRPSAEVLVADETSRRMAARLAEEILTDGKPTEQTVRAAEQARVSIAVERDRNSAWSVISAYVDNPDQSSTVPRAALRKRSSKTSDPAWLIVVVAPASGSALPVVALEIAGILNANSVILLSRHESIRQHDEAFVNTIHDVLGEPNILRIETSAHGSPELSVVGSVAGLPVVAIGQLMGKEVTLTFRPLSTASDKMANVPRLLLTNEVAESVGAKLLGAPEVLHWSGKLEHEIHARLLALTSVEPGDFRLPTVEELRLFDAAIAPRWLRPLAQDDMGHATPTPWERAILGQLGFRMVQMGSHPSEPEAWGILEPEPSETGKPRRGNPTWLSLVRKQLEAPFVLTEVPAPRWQIGTFGAGFAMTEAFDASAVMIAGALPSADPSGISDVRRKEGMRSYFHRWHEVWVGGGRHALSIQAIEADRSQDRDVVVSFGREVVRTDEVPPFAKPLLETLGDLQLKTTLYDGTREQVPFGGAMDIGMSYAKRFAEGRFGIVYLGSHVRRFFETRRFFDPDQGGLQTEARLKRLNISSAAYDVAERAFYLASCAPGSNQDDLCPTRRISKQCHLDAAKEGYKQYAIARNPYDLTSQLSGNSSPCYQEIVRDTLTERPWILIARPGQVELIPLDEALVATNETPLRTVERLRRAVAVGTSALSIEIGNEP